MPKSLYNQRLGLRPISCLLFSMRATCLAHFLILDLLTYLLTYSLHGTGYYLKSWLSLSLSKLSCFLYGTRRFITVLTKARHRTLSWASRIQFAPSIPISLMSILILSSHLRLVLPSGSSLRASQPKSCIHLSHSQCVPHVPPTSEYNLWSSSLRNFLRSTFVPSVSFTLNERC
jgi:hypothetical protein